MLLGLGEASIGMTAGRGRDGAGEADLLIEDIAGDAAPNEDLLL